MIFILLTGLNIFLAFNWHSHSPKYTYHSELWADRAGYFVYLPAVFQHDLSASEFPAGIDSLTGFGFRLDHSLDKFITKYTYGVALLQLPFYLIAHGVADLSGNDDPSFGNLDHWIVNVTGPLYTMLGLYLLLLFLLRTYDRHISFITALSILLCSNLLYYTVADPGMSHAYSFFLFAAFLLLLSNVLNRTRSIGSLALLGATGGLILLIRPTNLIFLAMAPILFVRRWNDLKSLITIGNIVPSIMALLLVWIPQMLYWDHLHGSLLIWSYESEGFTNWRSPRIIEFLLSPNNGLLPYTPFIVVVLWGSLILWEQKQKAIATAVLLTLALVCYVGASWWVWHFGCGFGSRTLVEYGAFFAIPIAAWLQTTSAKRGMAIPLITLGLLAFLQLKMMYSYDGCWHTGIWDWGTYSQLIFGPTK